MSTMGRQFSWERNLKKPASLLFLMVFSLNLIAPVFAEDNSASSSPAFPFATEEGSLVPTIAPSATPTIAPTALPNEDPTLSDYDKLIPVTLKLKANGIPVSSAEIRIDETVIRRDIQSNGVVQIPVGVRGDFRVFTVSVKAAEYGEWKLKTIVYAGEPKTIDVALSKEPVTKEDPLPRAVTEDLRSIEADRQQNDFSDVMFNPAHHETIPSTINVAITAYAHCSNWINAGQPVLRVETIDFKEYVKNVLPNEWISTWHTESLRAGAVAAKTYGWRKKLVGARHYLKDMHNLDKAPDIVDNTCDQRYIANTKKASTDQAVEDTWNYRISKGNALVVGFYLATESQCLNSPYQPCMPQWGTQYRAQEGKTWQQMVYQYYGNDVVIDMVGFPPDPGNVLYRFWSQRMSRHFYTSLASERNTMIANGGSNWQYEGFATWVVPANDPDSTPIYRFWSPRLRTHFYTVSEEEKNYILATYPSTTWTYEGEAYNVYPLEKSGSYQTVYRFWSKRLSTHFYTANDQERDHIIANYPEEVWEYEGPVWKVPIADPEP